MEATARRTGSDVAWGAAVDLAGRLANGWPLPTVSSPALVDPGEVVHADVAAHGWRFHGLDVAYPQPRVLAFGGFLTLGVASVASAAARRRARLAAERFAAPQWRALGQLQILATDRRLLVLHEGAWAPVWYPAINQLRPRLDQRCLELFFEDDPPYAVAGEWVPYLSVVLTAALAMRAGAEVVGAAILR